MGGGDSVVTGVVGRAVGRCVGRPVGRCVAIDVGRGVGGLVAGDRLGKG